MSWFKRESPSPPPRQRRTSSSDTTSLRARLTHLLDTLAPQALTPKEVAQRLEIPEGTAKWICSAATVEGLIDRVGRGRYVASGVEYEPEATGTACPVSGCRRLMEHRHTRITEFVSPTNFHTDHKVEVF